MTKAKAKAKSNKAKSGAAALPPLKPARAMDGVAVASCLSGPDEAASMVACGWQAMGTSAGRYVMVADQAAADAYLALTGGGDE